jgi:hypothetical protein
MILVQQRLKKEPTVKITRAGEVHASLLNANAEMTKDTIITRGHNPAMIW